jgi:hypothetical protein
MYRFSGFFAVILFSLGVAQEACAQPRNIIGSVALKSGESVEVLDLWYAPNCRSILTATPTAEVLEGPSEIAVTVKEAMVVPRIQECNKQVKGGKLILTAKDIDEYSTSKLTVRITFKSKDGETHRSYSYNVTLFPKQE